MGVIGVLSASGAVGQAATKSDQKQQGRAELDEKIDEIREAHDEVAEVETEELGSENKTVTITWANDDETTTKIRSLGNGDVKVKLDGEQYRFDRPDEDELNSKLQNGVEKMEASIEKHRQEKSAERGKNNGGVHRRRHTLDWWGYRGFGQRRAGVRQRAG